MKRFLALALIAVLALTMLAACGENKQETKSEAEKSSDPGSLIGVWRDAEDYTKTIEFKEDGQYKANSGTDEKTGTYTCGDGTFTVTCGEDGTFTSKYTIEGDTLTIYFVDSERIDTVLKRVN